MKLLIAAMATLICGSVLADDTDPNLRPGTSMPFHVVDFVGGARDSGSGCPSVMISNARTRGVEIWARSKADGTTLATAIDGKVPEGGKARVFLLQFDPSSRQRRVASPAEQALERILVAVPRGRRTPDLFAKAEPASDSSVIVFLMDRKTIKSRIELKPADLTPERIRAIAEKTGAFLAAK